ncbi:hypothetical protein [Microbacterium sp. CIAB417]|uniref:hypothetical protein n=1 Tax=Microbacterium sp. CIAB417 TaxID=2860287 RepID=UPI001FACA2DD|nr:hypothetical protein [Microbacterium sp. CIAB417]
MRPPVTIDYGARLTIGDRTFINADFMAIGGGAVIRTAATDLHRPRPFLGAPAIGESRVASYAAVLS